MYERFTNEFLNKTLTSYKDFAHRPKQIKLTLILTITLARFYEVNDYKFRVRLPKGFWQNLTISIYYIPTKLNLSIFHYRKTFTSNQRIFTAS